MEEKNWLESAMRQNQLAKVMESSRYGERFGLTLTEEEAKMLLQERERCLKEQHRVEFGESILPKLIQAFCDSDFVSGENYADVLARLQEIFYLFKNESLDLLTDDELLAFMREQYEDTCFGNLDYLEGTCLEVFVQAVRAGYRGYQGTGGRGEFEQFDIAPRWDRGLYLAALANLMEG